MFISQALTFAKLGNSSAGSMDITYQQVPCSPAGNMVVNVLDNGGAGAWGRFAVEVRVPRSPLMLQMQRAAAKKHGRFFCLGYHTNNEKVSPYCRSSKIAPPRTTPMTVSSPCLCTRHSTSEVTPFTRRHCHFAAEPKPS